ncbi:MAG: hypothetical protein AAFQ90_07115 [Pseudomonadota bacterium]
MFVSRFLLAIILFISPVLTGASGAGQNVEVPAPDIVVEGVVTYHLIQIALEGRPDLTEKFQTFTAAIRDCDDARTMKARLPVRVSENPSVQADRLPQIMREVVRNMPIGRATPVFGEPGSEIRVLVLCDRITAPASGRSIE